MDTSTFQLEENDSFVKFRRRSYATYDDYLEHQKNKLTVKSKEKNWFDWLSKTYDWEYPLKLQERLENGGIVKPQMSVLCLGARLGSEVKAFINMGCFAVGIDINPGVENKYVVTGDFHNLQFANDSIDVIFSNAFDHVFNIDRITDEIQRVLKPGGYLVLELTDGCAENFNPGEYEAFIWENVEDLVVYLDNIHMNEIFQMQMTYPYRGQHVVFKYNGTPLKNYSFKGHNINYESFLEQSKKSNIQISQISQITCEFVCGNNSRIGTIHAHGDKAVNIGTCCILGDGVNIVTSCKNININTGSLSSIDTRDDCCPNNKNIYIGNDVSIGNNVTILPGVNIGDGARVRSGSVVKNDILPFFQVAGSPAKVIQQRFNDKIISQLMEIKWWDWPEDKIIRNKLFFNTDLNGNEDINLFEMITP